MDWSPEVRSAIGALLAIGLWHAVGRWIIKTRTYGQVNLLAAGAALLRAAGTAGRTPISFPTTPRNRSRSTKTSATRSSSRMATMVSCPLEEMIISFVIQFTPEDRSDSHQSPVTSLDSCAQLG